MKELLYLHFFVIVALLFGCGHNGNERGSPAPVKSYTEAELSELIVPGMSVAELTNLFGTPDSELQISGTKAILSYSFAFNPAKEGPRMSGFDVRAEDGKVVLCTPILGSSHKMFQEPDESGTEYSCGAQTFAFFTLSDNLTNALKKFESGGSVDAGSLGVTPDVLVKAQVFAGLAASTNPAGKSIRLVIDNKDVPVLSAFTERNVGRRVLIALKNQVVAAPVIATPAVSRQFRFRIKDAHILNRGASKKQIPISSTLWPRSFRTTGS